MNRTRPRLTSLLVPALLGALVLGPGCVMGSPVAAFSGEPYGMTRDDVAAIGGDRWPIWGGHPVMAAIDIPFAAVLDTAFLPIALIVWGLSSLAGGGEDPDHGHSHGRGDDHDHGHGDEPHSHDDRHHHSHGDGYSHSHEGGDRPHEH